VLCTTYVNTFNTLPAPINSLDAVSSNSDLSKLNLSAQQGAVPVFTPLPAICTPVLVCDIGSGKLLSDSVMHADSVLCTHNSSKISGLDLSSQSFSGTSSVSMIGVPEISRLGDMHFAETSVILSPMY